MNDLIVDPDFSVGSKDWAHYPGFLSRKEADNLYESLVDRQWYSHPDDGQNAFALAFGIPYMTYLASPKDARRFPKLLTPGWKSLANRVSEKSESPVNYIQLHKYGPAALVSPHFDPGGMVVPMLTLGQERTFRVGGKAPQCYAGNPSFIPDQRKRSVAKHQPAEEYLMKHGDLLVFFGRNVPHSMFPANEDVQFNQNGFDWRISILFRWTTPAMEKFGPGKKANAAGTKEQYREAVAEWRSSKQ